MSKQQKEELKRILKEIYARRTEISPSKDRFYYKLKDGTIEDISPYISYDRFVDIVSNADLEYGLYVVAQEILKPSKECILNADFSHAIMQFISDFSISDRSILADLNNITNQKDPLEQVMKYANGIMKYRRFLLGQSRQPMYICSHVFFVKPYDPDPASIFHGKRGIIAYCTTIDKFVSMAVTVGIDKINEQFADILRRVRQKLHNNEEIYWFRNDVKMFDIMYHEDVSEDELAREQKRLEKKATKVCDINFIEKIIHSDINTANRVRAKYGIMRVKVPLER